MSGAVKRPRRRRWVLLGAPAVLGVVALLGWAWLRRSLPETSGSMRVAGVDAPVEIVRDRDGIPHVFAQSEPDAQFGLGFVHGQDRLWQLELTRRAASGRLAEIFGEDALGEDRLLRTVGLRRAAAASLPRLDAPTRRALDRYAEGINAAVAATPVLPPEFLVLGIEPEPWTALDVLVDMKLLAWQLAVQFGRELLRASLAEQLSPMQIGELLGGDAASLATQRATFGALAPALEALDRSLRRERAQPSAALGSNSWAVAGSRSSSGKPLLANDPHLALSMPAVWYLAHLSAPGSNVIGASIPGLPGVILGRNDRVAWSFTNNRADAQDLYLERVDPSDPELYLTPDGPVRFERVEEIIPVKGAAPHVLSVRSTRHGAVISDVDDVARRLMPAGHVLALKYAALAADDLSIRFPLEVARARNVRGVLDAARDLFSPPQNIVCADADGGLAFVAAGRVPRRSARAEARGLLPMPGWLGEFDWQGFVPFDELPQSEPSAPDVLVTANQELAAPGYPHWLGADWAAPIRSDRIRQRLEGRPLHDVESFAALQMDERSERAARLIDAFFAQLPAESLPDPALAEAVRRLQSWDFVMRRDAPEPLIFAEWLRELTHAVFEDELGERYADVAYEASEQLTTDLLDVESRWCDDVHTPAAESCASLARAALERALSTLQRAHGPDMAGWRWGAAHSVRFSHTPFGQLPVVGGWFDTLLPSGGGNDTVNLAEYLIADAEQPLTGQYGPSYRAIYDLGQPEASSFSIGVGQSGNPFSAHYRDFAERWLRGERVAMTTDRARIDASAVGTLVLQPAVP